MTSYIIKQSNTNVLVELAEGQTDSVSSSLTFIGKNVYKFGEIQNNNILHLLENFAAPFPPGSPLPGQLWFNSTNNTLTVYKDSTWNLLPNMTVVPTPSATDDVGGFMFNAHSGQLFVKSGTDYTLIGPTATPGYGKTQLTSDMIYGIESNPLPHPVLKCVVGDQVVAIISPAAFDINSNNAVTGFSKIVNGITLSSNNNSLSGIADKSNKILNEAGNSYISASTSAGYNTIVQRDSLGNIAVHNLTVASIAASASVSVQGQLSANSVATSKIYGPGELFQDWTVHGSIRPFSNLGSNLGNNSARWASIYSQLVDTSGVQFQSLTDTSANTITGFDTDTTLSTNSDNMLVTQKAVKSYIDSAINELRRKVDSIPLFPVGTVLYTAASRVPADFLAANGQSILKSSYPELYAVIGGTYGQTTDSFNLPDLRGMFVRGLDSYRGIDTNRQIGSVQNDEFRSHNHASKGGTNFVNYPEVGGQARQEQEQQGGPESYSSRFPTTENTGGAETRPINIALIGIIKF